MEDNLTNQQLAPSPNQEITSQDVTPTEVKNKPKFKKIFIILISFLTILFIGVFAYVFINKNKSEEVKTPPNNVPVTNTTTPVETTVLDESPFGKLTDENFDNNSGCNNMQCLIDAVKNCDPITATISYSNESNQLLLSMKIFNEMVFSGRTIYEVKNTNEEEVCSMSISTPVAVAKLSEEGKKELIELGATEQDMLDLLKPINDSLSLIEVAHSKKVCTGNKSELVELLSDSQKENLNVEVTNGEILYTTLSGKSIKCYIQEPPKQKANTKIQITAEECENKSGLRRFVVVGEEACYVGETDLGRVILENTSTTPVLQCCVAN